MACRRPRRLNYSDIGGSRPQCEEATALVASPGLMDELGLRSVGPHGVSLRDGRNGPRELARHVGLAGRCERLPCGGGSGPPFLRRQLGPNNRLHGDGGGANESLLTAPGRAASETETGGGS